MWQGCEKQKNQQESSLVCPIDTELKNEFCSDGSFPETIERLSNQTTTLTLKASPPSLSRGTTEILQLS